MELNDYILKGAMQADICKPWAEQIASAGNVDELLSMYVKGIDFCLKNNFPSNADLVRLAGDKLQGYGIYIDNPGIDLRNCKTTALLGSCYSDLNYDKFTVAQAFIKHTSTARVVASDNSFIVIDCFDDSTLDVRAFGNAKVLVNVYGRAVVTTDTVGGAVIKIVQKNKSTY